MMKAQFSLETLFTIMVVLFIFTVLIVMTIDNQYQNSRVASLLKEQTTCHRFTNEVQSLFILGDGTSTINLENNISINGKLVSIDNVFCRICCLVKHNGQTDFNISAGPVTITNQNGELIV